MKQCDELNWTVMSWTVWKWAQFSKHVFDLNAATVIIYCEDNRTDGEHLADQYLLVAHAVHQDFNKHWGNDSKSQLVFLLLGGKC